MAYQPSEYNGDGSTVRFNFSFPYLDRSHVFVLVDDAPVGFSFFNESVVEIDTAPAVGTKIVILRSTPLTPIIDFTNGSTLQDTDLDVSYYQNLYITEELSFRFSRTALGASETATLAAGQAAAAAAATAALELSARAFSDDAESFAISAAEQKLLAEAARNQSQSFANAANTSRDEAQAFASDALTSTSASNASRLAADVARDQAGQAAQAAVTSADEARSAASDAEVSASSASTAANSAAVTLLSTQSAANAAATSASTASARANEAATSAQAAQESRLAAEASRNLANSSASAASSSATLASQRAAEASSSATAAATSAQASENSRIAANSILVGASSTLASIQNSLNVETQNRLNGDAVEAQARASAVSSLQSQITTNNTNANARIDQTVQAISNESSARASAINALNVSFNGLNGTVQTQASLIANLQGVQGQYRIIVDAGVPGGISIISNANGSRIELDATAVLINGTILEDLIAQNAITEYYATEVGRQEATPSGNNGYGPETTILTVVSTPKVTSRCDIFWGYAWDTRDLAGGALRPRPSLDIILRLYRNSTVVSEITTKGASAGSMDGFSPLFMNVPQSVAAGTWTVRALARGTSTRTFASSSLYIREFKR